MAYTPSGLSLERYAFQTFLKEMKTDKYKGQRWGQAFYNHFKLHKITDQSQVGKLYELDGQVAKDFATNLFTFK
jgi:hypothetical protein